tara:strand:- start:79 stop:1296 length:1218 start_codon:yes stop_codon:yes gene_type:complete
MTLPYKNLSEITNDIKSRDIVIFGSGKIAKNTIRLFKKFSIKFIVDNSKNLWGTKYEGKNVLSPSSLKNKNSKFFVLICSTSINEISEQLIGYNFKSKKDFTVSPILENHKIIDDLESIERNNIIFTSGSAINSKSNKYGGGLYKLNIDKYKWDYEKIYNGCCYGIKVLKDEVNVIDDNYGVIVFDKKTLKIKKKIKLPKNIRPHGIEYSPELKRFYICCTQIDKILEFNNKFKLIKKISISDKFKYTGSKQHHINDCYIQNNYIYISMFSISGNYNSEVYDGGILEINLKNNKQRSVLCNNLWMPHNVCSFNESIHVLNSLKGELLAYNLMKIGEFPAFTRGLEFENGLYFIGQSRNRNFSKYLGVSNNISIDAGIIIFDGSTKVSRFLQFDPRVSEIHSIKFI